MYFRLSQLVFFYSEHLTQRIINVAIIVHTVHVKERILLHFELFRGKKIWEVMLIIEFCLENKLQKIYANAY